MGRKTAKEKRAEQRKKEWGEGYQEAFDFQEWERKQGSKRKEKKNPIYDDFF